MARKTTKVLSIEKPKHFFRPFYNKCKGYSDENEQMVYEPRLPGKIVLVGCGGNGGYLAPLLARYLGTSPSEILRNIQLHFVDGDAVSEKNILRQNFIQSDIGMNKADILAERCNMAFGLSIVSHQEFLTSGLLTRLSAAARSQNGERVPEGIDLGRTLIVGCVDRHEVRSLIAKFIVGKPHLFYIDVGNELKAGQVFLSGPVKIRTPQDEDVTLSGNGIRIDEFYPSIAAADPDKSEPSCAEQTAGGLQRMDVNVKAATLTFEAVCSVLSPAEIPYFETTFGPGISRSERIDDLDIKDVSGAVTFSRPK